MLFTEINFKIVENLNQGTNLLSFERVAFSIKFF